MQNIQLSHTSPETKIDDIICKSPGYEPRNLNEINATTDMLEHQPSIRAVQLRRQLTSSSVQTPHLTKLGTNRSRKSIKHQGGSGKKINFTPMTECDSDINSKKTDKFFNMFNDPDKQHAVQKQSTRYWISPNNIDIVHNILHRHLQYSGTGINGKKHISNIYYDNDEYKCYYERLFRRDESFSFRYSWQCNSGNNLNINGKGYLEQKLRGNAIRNIECSKQQIPCSYDQLKEYMTKGKLPIVDKKYEQTLKVWWSNYIQDVGFKPKVMTIYERTCYESTKINGADPSYRISIDEDLVSVDCCGLSYEVMAKEVFDAERMLPFPVCVMDIEMFSHDDKMKEVILDLEISNLIVPAGNFSKFITGIAVHHGDNLTRFPQWSENIYQLGKNTSQPRVRNRPGEKNGNEIEKPLVGLTPRNYLALERTWESWVMIGFLMGNQAMTMLQYDPDFKIVGILFLIASIGLMWYALKRYYDRLSLFDNRDPSKIFSIPDYYSPSYVTIGFTVFISIFIYFVLDDRIRPRVQIADE